MVYNISNKQIIQIACGWNHTLVFVEPYYVYAAGLSKYGELGLRDFEMRRSFTLIEDLAGKNVVEIFAGGYHSWFLFQYDEPDIDYEPPSPLLTTPVHSINEEEPAHKRPKSHDSDNPRRKKFTLDERNEINEKRNINIRGDDDLKRFEELLKGPRFGFDPETQDDKNDKFKQGRRTFDVLNPHPESVKKIKTPVARSPYTEEVDRGKKFNDIYMQTTDFGSKFAQQDNYNKKQLSLTPRSKFHQNVDEDPEMIIPGYQPISSDDDTAVKAAPPKSPIKDKNKIDTGDAGAFNFKALRNPVPPIEVSEDDENPPSINESDRSHSQNSYDQYEQAEHDEEEEYYQEGDEQDPSDDSNKDPWIRQPYKPQDYRQRFEPPSKNIAIQPPRFNTEDDVSDSHDNNHYKDRNQDDNRRNTANVPVQQPRQNQKRFKPQLTDDFGSDGEFNPHNRNPEHDEYAKLSRKMQSMLDKSKSDRSRKDNRNDYGDQPDDREAFKKQRGKKEVFQPSHSDEDADDNKFGGKRRSERLDNHPFNQGNQAGRGSENQGLYRSGPGEEFRGSFSQKPSKSDQYFDEFDHKNRNQRPKRNEPARIREHEEEDDESLHSLEEDDYRAVKDPRKKGDDGRNKRYKPNNDQDPKRDAREDYSDKNLDRQNSRGQKGFDNNDRDQRKNQRFDAPADNNSGYKRREEKVRIERNIYALDFRLFFVELKYCHRFAIMTCNPKDNQRIKSIIDDIVANLKQSDPQIQVTNFLPIEEFYEKDKSNFLTALGVVPGPGVNSYVLMMVSLPENYVNFQRQKRIIPTNYKEYKAAQSSIGPSFELSEAQISDDARLKMLANWYLTLRQKLWNETTSLRFLELRPSIYK